MTEPQHAKFTANREHTLRGRQNIDWLFANRRWLRLKNRTVGVGYAIRQLTKNEAAIRVLVVAPKRTFRRAHERNHTKRWLRAALAEAPAFAELESLLAKENAQLLLMLMLNQTTDHPRFLDIVAAINEAANLLAKQYAEQSLPCA